MDRNRTLSKSNGSKAAHPAVIRRQTRGVRAAFFDDPAIDQVMTYVIELATEVSVLRDRLAAAEEVLAGQGVLAADAVDTFSPEPAFAALRQKERKAFLERVFRTHLGKPGRGLDEDSRKEAE
jgi:hypothetical protein